MKCSEAQLADRARSLQQALRKCVPSPGSPDTFDFMDGVIPSFFGDKRAGAGQAETLMVPRKQRGNMRQHLHWRRSRAATRKAAGAICAVLTMLPMLACARTITIQPALREGQALRLEVVYENETYRPRVPDYKTSKTTAITATVRNKSAAGFQLHWQYGKSVVTGLRLSETGRKTMSALRDSHEGLVLIVQCSAQGAVEGVANPDQVRAHFEKALKHFRETFEAAALPPEAFEKALQDMRTKLVGPRMTENALNEPRLLMRFSGRSLTLNERLPQTDVVDNPLGGNPIPRRGWTSAKLSPANDKLLIIEADDRVDADALRRLTSESPSATDEEGGRSSLGETPEAELEIHEHSVYHIDLNLGVPVFIEQTVTSTVGPMKRVDRTTLRLLPSEAPL